MLEELSVIDELLSKEQHTNEELEMMLSQYANGIASGDPNFIDSYYERLDKLYLSRGNELELSIGLRSLLKAITCYYQTHFDKTVEPVKEAITLFKKLKHNDLLGLSYMIYGANCRSLGEIDEAVKYLYQGIEHIDDAGNVVLYKCYCYYQLAEINVSINDNEGARTNYLKAAEMAEKINDSTGTFRSYNGLGNLFIVEENYLEALVYLNKTLAINGITDAERSRTFCDLGVYYAKTDNLQQSKNYFEKSVEIRKELNLKNAESTALIGLGGTLLALGLPDASIEKLNEALVICQEFNSRQKLMECYHLLAKAYQKNGNWQLSVEAYEQYDVLQQEVSSKQLQKIYQLKNNKIAEQKQQIEIILKEVHDSINYAKGIQQAILPSDGLVKSLLPNAFVLYEPKDVVSGDFYFLESVGDTVIYAVADCTGHGVPGALVSVVCVNALNRSVREFGLTNPAEILVKTREIVIETFEKSDHEVKDGMDIALCTITGNQLTYSGAHNPLWIIRNKEIIEVKADKQPVGKHMELKPFTSHCIELQEGDTVYTFTDGYVDQFGGPKGKKFKARNFRELLLSVQNNAMEEQENSIHQAFKSWKGNLEQVDDVCIIGVRV